MPDLIRHPEALEKAGFPRIKYGPGLVEPGMTDKENWGERECRPQVHTTLQINPLKYSPSGWHILMGWSQGCPIRPMS